VHIELSTTVQSTVDSIAGRLLRAQAERQRVPPLSEECRNLNFDLAYRIQDEALSQRIERGEHLVGITVRPGSPVAPLTAWLTDAMALCTGDSLPTDLLVHPGVEPSIAFVMGRRLSGPGITCAAALAAVDLVFGSLEITDSRYADGLCTLPDRVADNLSSSHYLTGPVGIGPAGLNLPLEAACITVGERVTAPGVGAVTVIPPRPLPQRPIPWPAAAMPSRPAGPSSSVQRRLRCPSTKAPQSQRSSRTWGPSPWRADIGTGEGTRVHEGVS
jgi:2-oxo-3-hexenedioate decarboxylase